MVAYDDEGTGCACVAAHYGYGGDAVGADEGVVVGGCDQRTGEGRRGGGGVVVIIS